MIIDDNMIKQHGLVIAAVYNVISNNPSATQSTIADLCGISVRTVRRALENLQRLGYIKVKSNPPHTNTYVILPASISKIAHGNYGHVLLSGSEYTELVQVYGNEMVETYIRKLDNYIEVHPEKHYSAHHQVISDWITEDRAKQQQKNIPKGAKHWYGGKTYGELIETLPEEKRARYLSVLSKSQLHEVATMPVDDYINAIIEQREYEMYAFRMEIEGDE